MSLRFFVCNNNFAPIFLHSFLFQIVCLLWVWHIFNMHIFYYPYTGKIDRKCRILYFTNLVESWIFQLFFRKTILFCQYTSLRITHVFFNHIYIINRSHFTVKFTFIGRFFWSYRSAIPQKWAFLLNIILTLLD